MNLQKINTAINFFEAMPADLQERYIDAPFKRIELDETRYEWDEFINQSFTWSDTKEGHNFWSAVHHMTDLSQYEAVKFKTLEKPIREHLKNISAELRAILFDQYKSYLTDSELNNLIAQFTAGEKNGHLDGKTTWYDYMDNQNTYTYPRAFWRELSTATSYEAVNVLSSYQLEEIEIHGGGKARRCELIKLSAQHYGENAYTAKRLATDSDSGAILEADLLEYYDREANKRRSHKSILEKTLERNGFNVPMVVYCPRHKMHMDSRISYRYGVGINYETGQPEAIELHSHALVRSQNGFRFSASISELEASEHLVYVNHKEYEYKVYMIIQSSSVYYDIVTQKYYFEDVNPWREYMFYGTAGAPCKYIKINSDNQIPIAFEYFGQRFAPVHTQARGSYSAVWYFSRESAENAGLILNTCPSCGNLHSQYHDIEECEQANFTNERYSYHSQKPRYISSRSEFKIGVEIEKESFKGARHNNREIFRSFGWVKESDGSLDSRVGYELVSPAFGLFGNNLIKEAEKLEAKFPSLINGETSKACGGHIHFSRANTSGADTLEMYCGYLPLLYAIYKTRTKASYCAGKEKDEMKYSRDKYQAVRVLDNRIEFRIFPAVKNVSTLAWRIELLRYMAKNPTASPVQVVNDLCDKRTKLHKLFLEIFTEKTIYARAIDTLNMAQKYDRNYYNIDFSKERTAIAKKAEKTKV
jgi:hypothetical protein